MYVRAVIDQETYERYWEPAVVQLSSWDYRCKRLATLGLLDQVSKKQRRGATEWFYFLSLNGQRPE